MHVLGINHFVGMGGSFSSMMHIAATRIVYPGSVRAMVAR